MTATKRDETLTDRTVFLGLVQDMNSLPRRSAGEIRIAFKILTWRTFGGHDQLKEFDLLWEEANSAAAEVVKTLAAGDYLALLREMNSWHVEEKVRLARSR